MPASQEVVLYGEGYNSVLTLEPGIDEDAILERFGKSPRRCMHAVIHCVESDRRGPPTGQASAGRSYSGMVH